MADDGLRESFKLFAVFGDSKSTGKEMTGKNFTKCCKECNVINKKLTGTDVDIAFTKVAKSAKKVTFDGFKEVLIELSKKRFAGKDKEEQIKSIFALVEGKGPGTTGTTKTSKTGGVEKMTDTSQYTGAHKERFGADGKGKGLDGRADRVENTGYVGNYKGDGTYDEKVGK